MARSDPCRKHCAARPAHIVESIVKLGAALGIRVVAEGIETAERAIMGPLGCSVGQGYIFALPMDAAAFGGLPDNGLVLQDAQDTRRWLTVKQGDGI